MNATSKDLRYKTKSILKAVAAGKQVIITYRGVAKAVIQSIAGASSAAAEDDSESVLGMWADREDIGDVSAHVRSVRRGRVSRL